MEADYNKLSKEALGEMIRGNLEIIRNDQGWTVDLLAQFFEVNALTLRNMIGRNEYGDLFVLIFKLKGAITEVLCNAYRNAIEKEKIEQRKGQVKKEGKRMAAL